MAAPLNEAEAELMLPASAVKPSAPSGCRRAALCAVVLVSAVAVASLFGSRAPTSIKPSLVASLAGGPPSSCPNFTKDMIGGTNCPADEFLTALVLDLAAKSGEDLVIFDVGCNKGTDSVKWLDRKHPGIRRKWMETIEELYDNTAWLACGNDVAAAKAAPAPVPSGHGSLRVVCVEPLPVNVELLHKVSAKVWAPGSGLTAAASELTVVASAAAEAKGTSHMPAGLPPGSEAFGIGSGTVPVPVTTVDDLAAGPGLGSVDVLQIDAEGWDAAVLRGAEKVLQNVRLLKFEVHQDVVGSPWSNTTLLSVIEHLDGLGLDCFWAARSGSLPRLTGCWTESEERQFHPLFWTNVNCLRRGDPLHDLALQRAPGQ